MATMTISINTGQGTVTRNRTVSGAHLLRFLAAYKALLGRVPSGPADPVTGIVPMRDMTDEECILAWADGLFAGTKANVLSQERAAAATTASNAVAEITLT